jgi:hypothetical protein
MSTLLTSADRQSRIHSIVETSLAGRQARSLLPVSKEVLPRALYLSAFRVEYMEIPTLPRAQLNGDVEGRLKTSSSFNF